MYIRVALQRKNKQMRSLILLYTIYFMNKEYIERIQNGKKVFLTGVFNIAI